MMKIRKFSPEDLARIMEIEKKSFSAPWPKSYYKKLYNQHPDDFIIAEKSKKIAGYALGYKKPNGSGSIKTIAVDPDYRQQGIGKELITHVINKLEKEGVKDVYLHTRTINKTAQAFYKSFGFKIIKTIENYYPDGNDAYLMKKELGG